MNKELFSYPEFDHLQEKIKNTYTEGVTMDEAEKLAAEFLDAQLKVSKILANTDLDARMKKTGLKAIKAAVYLAEASKGEKKPTEAALAAKVDTDELVQSEQKSYDAAEVERELLQNYYNVFREAHVYFRGISKGRFDG